MLQVKGILETALYVDDVKTATDFYTGIFSFTKLFEDDRLCALNVANRQVLLLFRKGASLMPSQLPGGIIPAHDSNGPAHFAFVVDKGSLEAWEEHLQRKGVTVESRVDFVNSSSIYFRDTDNHLVELAEPGIWPVLS